MRAARSSSQHNLELLGEANVGFQVILEGPAMQLRELAGLQAGQVVRFDYPLEKPLASDGQRYHSDPVPDG